MPAYEWRAYTVVYYEGGRIGYSIRRGSFIIASQSHEAAERKMFDELEKLGYPEETVRSFDLEKIDDETY